MRSMATFGATAAVGRPVRSAPADAPVSSASTIRASGEYRSTASVRSAACSAAGPKNSSSPTWRTWASGFRTSQSRMRARSASRARAWGARTHGVKHAPGGLGLLGDGVVAQHDHLVAPVDQLGGQSELGRDGAAPVPRRQQEPAHRSATASHSSTMAARVGRAPEAAVEPEQLPRVDVGGHDQQILESGAPRTPLPGELGGERPPHPLPVTSATDVEQVAEGGEAVLLSEHVQELPTRLLVVVGDDAHRGGDVARLHRPALLVALVLAPEGDERRQEGVLGAEVTDDGRQRHARLCRHSAHRQRVERLGGDDRGGGLEDLPLGALGRARVGGGFRCHGHSVSIGRRPAPQQP